MKILIYCLAFIMFSGNSSLLMAEEINKYLISSGKAGSIKLEMSRKDVLSHFDKSQINEKIDVGEEEWEFKVIDIILTNEIKPAMSLQMDSNCTKSCKILTMAIYDPKFMTSKGICVGKSIDELIEKHGVDKIHGVKKITQFECLFDKCDPIVYTVDLENVGFILDSNEADWSFGKFLKLQDIPKETKIRSIYLF